MAIRMSIEQHHVAFPTKVLSDKVGKSIKRFYTFMQKIKVLVFHNMYSPN